MIKLSSRLQIVFDFIPSCCHFADVGCDHGYLSIAVVKANLCEKAIAMDVNPGPLARAEKNVKAEGLKDKIELRLSDGLNKLEASEADVICICGMGGVLMQRILSADLDKAKRAKCLILEPQSEYMELRIFLDENGFTFDDEALVTEENKIYPVFKVHFDGNEKRLNEVQKKFGPVILEKKPELFKVQLEKMKAEDERIVSSLRKKKDLSEMAQKRLEVLLDELSLIDNALALFGGR